MPERLFVEQDVAALIKTRAALSKALTSGSLEELRISGVMTRTGSISQQELSTRYKQARYELWLAGQGKGGRTLSADALALEPTNPYLERVTRVETVQQSAPWPGSTWPC